MKAPEGGHSEDIDLERGGAAHEDHGWRPGLVELQQLLAVFQPVLFLHLSADLLFIWYRPGSREPKSTCRLRADPIPLAAPPAEVAPRSCP